MEVALTFAAAYVLGGVVLAVASNRGEGAAWKARHWVVCVVFGPLTFAEAWIEQAARSKESK